ncbi:hypothetical protein GOQ04_20860 [Emticicia sp. ODNR4P]|nr:hypothetical protein [Emticicia sp. ODNR4P]
MKKLLFIIGLWHLCFTDILAQNTLASIDQYNVIWNSPSQNAAESMPCGGGDIGLNVWVEKGDIYFYIARSGTFDHNNAVLKLGRMRLTVSPNVFENPSTFTQVLRLSSGDVVIEGSNGKIKTQVKIWVDVFSPNIYVEVNSNQPITAKAQYESWRYQDRLMSKGKENNANSYKWAPPHQVVTRKDSIRFAPKGILFYHENGDEISAFDVVVKQQGLDSLKKQFYNPLKNLVFGGIISGNNWQQDGTAQGKYRDTDFKAWKIKTIKSSRQQQLMISLHTATTTSISDWEKSLLKTQAEGQKDMLMAQKATHNWWKEFWQKSFIHITPNQKNSKSWEIARNYQVFRYQLACNNFGQYPTKFNGGLFTVDPYFTDTTMKFTPDFRNWGGGTHTAQNQRLVYWGLLKTGDFEAMKPQFDFYKRILNNAELRTKYYWGHQGASFTEQIENFGLPNPAEYGWKRPAGYDKGMEYNAWLEYEWDTALEFCSMILETERFTGKNITEYIPLIESCLRFFDEHYQYLAKKRGSKALDGNKQLVIYPGSGAETYKMAYNPSSTIAGLKTVLEQLLSSPSLASENKKTWEDMLSRIPPMSFRQFENNVTIAPAKTWERINNVESPQLYPIFPWNRYGVGKAGLDTARNTYLYDTDVLKFRSHIGWKQDVIFAARLGLREEAQNLLALKLQNAPRRFPTFWGPGYDWTPDHNWGGSGMIGLQEMLLQTTDQKIYLLPAWPKEWDVHFKLQAPYQTSVEVEWENGKLEKLIVIPESRQADIIEAWDLK